MHSGYTPEGAKLILRKYKPCDCKEITELFFDTVHAINAKDYTEAQLNAWATGQIDLEIWNQSLLAHYSMVAEDHGVIVGFGDMDKNGYLDRLYVHKCYQNMGIATAICNALEQFASGKIVTHASITAKPFFLKRGYMVIKAQQVERRGVILENFVMEKQQCSADIF